MERSAIIRYCGEYFGDINFFYNNYYQGMINAKRKEFKDVVIQNETFKDLIEVYSVSKPFEHPKVSLENIRTLDMSYLIDCFNAEITTKKIDTRDFQITYLEEIIFERFFWNQTRGFVGKTVICVNSEKQTKTSSFISLIPELDLLNENKKEPFDKINKQVFSEYLTHKVGKMLPDTNVI